jgi:RNA polymerase sigma factor (sigma-70 family)
LRARLPGYLNVSSRAPSPPGDHRDAAPSPTTADARFEALVRDYGRLIRHVVCRVGGAAAQNDRDDIEQAVLLSLWTQLAREQTIDHPASYVYRAAVRETVRAVARLRARAEQTVAGGLDELPAERQSDADRGVEAREQREALQAALRALPGDRARAVRAHLAGFTVEELMQVCGWPYQRARNLVARGMADLRTHLRSRGLS